MWLLLKNPELPEMPFLKAGETEASQGMYHLMHNSLVNGERYQHGVTGVNISSPQAPIGLGLYTPGHQFLSLLASEKLGKIQDAIMVGVLQRGAQAEDMERGLSQEGPIGPAQLHVHDIRSFLEINEANACEVLY